MINFPNSPALNAAFAAPDGGQYIWDGVKWAPTTAPYTGMSGMVAGQIPIAATATTVTSSANLSGDITSNATLVTTLATVNSNVGTFQGITVNAKGLVTAAVNQNYVTGGPYLAIAGGTLTGKLITLASATGGAGLNLPHGAAPTAPVNGDIWTTTAGIYVRINAVTVGPLGTGGGGGLSGMTAGQIAIAATATTVTSSIPTTTFVARAGDTMTGPLSIFGAIPAGGHASNIYAFAVTLTYTAFNLYLNAANSAWLRKTGTGTGGVFYYDTGLNVFAWQSTPTGAADSAATTTLIMNLASAGALTTAGPIAAGNYTIPTTGHPASIYGITLTTQNWLSHNVYIDTGAVTWRHRTGSGTGAVFGYDGSTQFAWYSTTNAAINAPVTLTNLMTLNNAGDLVIVNSATAGVSGRGRVTLNQGDATGAGYVRLTRPDGSSLGYLGFNPGNPSFTIEYSGYFYLYGGNFTVSNGQILSRGAGAMLAFDQRDNAGIQWGWYATANAARLWNSTNTDRLIVDNVGNTTAAGVVQSNVGRVMSTSSSGNNPGFCCYDTLYGYASGIIQAGNLFYLCQMDGAGAYVGNFASFGTDRTMTMGSFGIRYPNAYGGGTNAFAFGWYSSYPPPAYAGISATIDNGAAQIGLTGTTLASDRRMKTDIAPSTFDSLAAVNAIALRQFRWLHIPKPSALKEAELLDDAPLNPVGVIAQEVMEVFPEAVTPGDDFDDKLGRIWALDNSVLIPALIGAVQQLTTRLKALEEK